MPMLCSLMRNVRSLYYLPGLARSKRKKNISVDLYMYFISVYAVVQKMDEKGYTIKYAENAFSLSSDIW